MSNHRWAIAAFLAVIALSGCSVYTSKDSRTGQDKNVDIRTPLGSISVHTGESDPKDMEDHDGGANVNISSSFFGVKVVALKYQSSDSPDRVLGFYRKEMAKYGKVLDCTGGFNMTFHHHDGDSEVTCDDHSGSGHQYSEELKVGTEKNQRIVAVKPSGSGSEFALVYVRASDAKDTM
jgi:hypothetical protein